MEIATEQIMSMEPGEEMDALVAEHVFGRLVTWNRAFYYLTEEERKYQNEAFVVIPEYSTDITSAWEVFEKLIQMHGDACITSPWLVSADYDPMREEPWKIRADGKTAPEAICKAALLAAIDSTESTQR